jgi:hypothetical protein
VTGASAAIATTWIAQKNDLVERYDDPVICTYPLSKFGVVVVEKARQNKIDKRREIWLKRDSLPPRRSVSRATMKAIVSKDSEQSIATEDTLRLMRNNGISPPTVARITRVKTMASSRPKMWTESQWMPECAAGAADALLRLLRKVEVHQVNRGQIMERQNCNIKEIMESRRHAVEESLRTISVAELNALADELFPDFDHPFLEKFVGVINDPGSGPFYHAHAGGWNPGPVLSKQGYRYVVYAGSWHGSVGTRAVEDHERDRPSEMLNVLAILSPRKRRATTD